MSSVVNKLLSEIETTLPAVEEMLYECLTDKGMTNAQALDTIESTLGTNARACALTILHVWKEEDTDDTE